MNEAKILDQFYTNPVIAEYYYNLLSEKFNLVDFFLFEPSAGQGSFSDLFHSDSLATDLSPKKDYIKRKDFFSIKKSSFKTKKPIFTIGNPPFGKNASLALKFINKSSDYSSYIAFVLPKTFKKQSMINKIDSNLHLVYEEDLPEDSFLHEGKKYNVPCVFQIWEKRKDKRKKIILKTKSEYFDFCKKEEADFAIRRVGVLAGKVFEEHSKYKDASHYYIKSRKNKDVLLYNMKKCFHEFQEIARNTAGNPSLSKSELIQIYENYLK